MPARSLEEVLSAELFFSITLNVLECHLNNGNVSPDLPSLLVIAKAQGREECREGQGCYFLFLLLAFYVCYCPVESKEVLLLL